MEESGGVVVVADKWNKIELLESYSILKLDVVFIDFKIQVQPYIDQGNQMYTYAYKIKQA